MSSTCKIHGTSRLADLKLAISMNKISVHDFFFNAAAACNPQATVGHVLNEIRSYTRDTKSYSCPDWLVQHVLNVINVNRALADASVRNGIGGYVGHPANHQ